MSSENEKTMRPDAPADKTMRPDAPVEKTIRPDVSADKTMRPDAQPNKTMRPDDQSNKTLRPDVQPDKTMRPQNQQGEIDRIVHQQETEFTLGKGVKYQLTNVISKHSGEADIFLVENNSKQFVLKLYRVGIRPNEVVLKIICKNSGSGFLVDTYECGIWTNPNNSQEVRDYELMPYYEGGSLDQLKIPHDENGEKQLCEIAIRSAATLDFLHRLNVLHRDVKPANFFFKTKEHNIDELAIADFGIAIPCDAKGFAEFKNQLRTPIYPAPEYYDSVQNEKGETLYKVDTKSDFFALGMTLLTLWSGEKEFSQYEDEFKLKNIKKFGELPYPSDVSDRTLQLLKALTHPNFEKRAGIEEIIHWVQGKDIYDLKQGKEDVRLFKIIFNAAKNQIANSPEELAQFIWEDKDLSIKYLYSGKIAQWLAANDRPELVAEVEDIVENQHPKDKEAGFYAACYMLDPAMPYFDVKGKPLTNVHEIAQSLKSNMKHYEKALENKDDSLFLFFNARGAANVTREFAPLFKKNKKNRDALLQLIHMLDPTSPWIVTTEEDLKIECYKIEDVLKAYSEHTFSDDSWNDLIGEAFLIWVRQIDPAVEGKIRSQKGHKDRQTVVLYNLSPQIAYNFQMDKDADNYFFTPEEVGNLMNIHMEEYIQDSENNYASVQLDMMCKIDDTRLYDYFKSKGSHYDDRIEWIKYCADINSEDNANKAGPYNWKIGVYKAIKGLGYSPFYYFPKSDKRIYTLDELNQIPSKEVKEELKKGYLESWLTTFYQEDPYLDLSPKYAYEKEVVKFLGHLEKIDPKDSDVINYNIGKDHVEKGLSDLRRKRNVHVWSKILVGLLTLLASAAVIYGALMVEIPINAKDHVGWISIAAIAAAILGVIGMFFLADDSGCLVNLIVGAIIGGAVYAILYFCIPFIGYIAIGLLALSLILWLIKSYLKYPLIDKSAMGVDHKKLLNPTFEELHLEPLHFAYSDDQTFRSSIGDQSYYYADYLSIGTKEFYKQLIFPWILILGLGTAIYFFSPNFKNLGRQVFNQKNQYELFVGDWKGTFDNTVTTFTISEANKDEVFASILVNYRKPLQETLKGTIDMDTRAFQFDDVNPTNKILDGGYKGSFSQDFASFSGEYQNYTTKKVVKFNFSKEAVAEAAKGKAEPASEKASKSTTSEITQERETKTAEAKTEKMQTPTDATGWYNQGLAYSAEGKYSEAINSYQKALDLDSSVGNVWYDMGNAYQHVKNYNEAVACYELVTTRNKSNDVAWYNLGICYDAQNKKDEAINAYKKAAELGNKEAQEIVSSY